MNLEIFETGIEPVAYANEIRNYRSFVKSAMEVAEASAEHVGTVSRVTSELSQPVRATIMTEDWCGDSACNTPILASLLAGAGIELRVLRSSDTPDLKNYIENHEGAHEPTEHIPVLSIWDDDWNELVRWVEAPVAVAERKTAWKAERPEFMELFERMKTDEEAAKKWAVMYRGFLEEMLGWYRDGMWNETTREVTEALAASSGS